MSSGTYEIIPAPDTEPGEALRACAALLRQDATAVDLKRCSAVPPSAADSAEQCQPQTMSLVQLVGCIASQTSTDSTSSGGDGSPGSSGTASNHLQQQLQLHALQELASRARSAAPELSDHHTSTELKQTAVAGVVSLLQQHSGDRAAPAAVALALEALLALSHTATSYKSRIAKQPGALRALAMLLQGASSSSSGGGGSAEATSSHAPLRLSLAADAIKCLAWDGLGGHTQNQLRIAAQPGLIGALVALFSFDDAPEAAHTSDKSAAAEAANTQQQCQQQPCSTEDVVLTTLPAAAPEPVAAAQGPAVVSAASVRRKAAHALACICAGNAITQSAVAATPGAISSLVGMLLRSPDAGERLQAADAMAQLLIVRSAGGRLMMLHRPNQQAMGTEPAAVPALVAALMGDADSGVRLQAQTALKALVQGSQDNAERLKTTIKAAKASCGALTGSSCAGGKSSSVTQSWQAQCDWLQTLLLQGPGARK